MTDTTIIVLVLAGYLVAGAITWWGLTGVTEDAAPRRGYFLTAVLFWPLTMALVFVMLVSRSVDRLRHRGDDD